jgi:hypothetical protein
MLADSREKWRSLEFSYYAGRPARLPNGRPEADIPLKKKR